MLRKILRYGYEIAVIMVSSLALLMSPVRCVRRLITHGKTRSIWASTPIINMANNAKAERFLDVNSKSLVYDTYYITDNFDYNLERLTSIFIIGRLVPLAIYFWACLFVDRLHFYCDKGLLPSIDKFSFDPLELYIYKVMKIQVFLWTYGADVRSRSITMEMGYPNCCSDCDNIGKYCICDEKKRVRNLSRLSKHSNAIFSGMGDMFNFTPGSINDTFFWPIDLDSGKGKKYIPVYPKNDGMKPLRIVHACNHRIFKGTNYLIQAIEELQAEGVNVKLILVERIPNERALEIYRSADVIFDQCLMGNYGYFAIEAMALGKPVLCFIRDPEKYLLYPGECPIINVHVESLKKDIRELVENRDSLEDIGRRSREYVEKYFSLEAFAQRLRRAYDELGVLP